MRALLQQRCSVFWVNPRQWYIGGRSPRSPHNGDRESGCGAPCQRVPCELEATPYSPATLVAHTLLAAVSEYFLGGIFPQLSIYPSCFSMGLVQVNTLTRPPPAGSIGSFVQCAWRDFARTRRHAVSILCFGESLGGTTPTVEDWMLRATVEAEWKHAARKGSELPTRRERAASCPLVITTLLFAPARFSVAGFLARNFVILLLG